MNSTVPAVPATPARLRLTSEAALEAGLAALAALDPDGVARLLAIGGHPALRHHRQGFAGLAAAITGQQVSTASAAAMFERMELWLRPLTPTVLLQADDALLRRCGLSAAKMGTLRTVAAAIVDGRLPIDRLVEMPAPTAHRVLVAHKGIGPWTADVYLLFCLGEPDAFPAGDLALQEAYRLVFGGEHRPGAAELVCLAARWQPWRGVAATLLWACYRVLRGGGPTPPSA